MRTENSNTFAGATLGLEAFTSIFDLRVNAHVPIGGGATLSPSLAETASASSTTNWSKPLAHEPQGRPALRPDRRDRRDVRSALRRQPASARLCGRLCLRPKRL
ncbi:MAG: hypothetical protein HPM95_05170 [Alphaproteobacteria bacterium]|nr:hypothetical protein [Alphaproteobacteria bacterium]